MNPLHAYAYGALVKMAEHQVDPANFVRAASRSQDPGALKIARAILEYEQAVNQEKTANRMRAVLQKGQDLAEGAGQAMASPMRKADEFLDQRATAKAIKGKEGQTDEAIQMAEEILKAQNRQLGGAALKGTAGLGALAAGGKGLEYGLSPEDTTANQIRDMLGMEQQSRLGAGLEGLGANIPAMVGGD